MNRFDDAIRQKLSNHTTEVPADAWSNIQQELVEDNSIRYVLFYWMTGLLIIALMGLLVFKTITPQESIIESIVDVEAPVEQEHTLNENSVLLPLESEVSEQDAQGINNLIITSSTLEKTRKVDVSDSSFIKNLKVIQELRKK